MRKIFNLLTVLALVAFVSCEKAKEYPWNDAWDKYQHEVTVPEEPDEPSAPVAPAEGKERLVWIDAAANFKDYANSKESISKEVL